MKRKFPFEIALQAAGPQHVPNPPKLGWNILAWARTLMIRCVLADFRLMNNSKNRLNSRNVARLKLCGKA
jgi:hypothetical protein